MKRLLVTGANGQLGLSIKDIVNEYPDIEFIFKDRSELDITNIYQVNTIFEFGKFDYCINCAAYTNVEQAERTPENAFSVNTEGVKNIALACKKNNVVLIHISTDYVFDGKKGEPYTVEDTPNPINEYGKSKWEGEKYIQKILSQYFIVRTSWLYHKKHGNNFYRSVLEKLKSGELLCVTDDQIGSPTNSSNLALFLLNLIGNASKLKGIYHFTDKDEMTWFGFAQKIIEENNFKIDAKIVKGSKYNSFALRPKYSVLQN